MDGGPAHVTFGRPVPADTPILLSYTSALELGLISPLRPPIANLPLKKTRAFQAPSNASPRELFTHQASEHTKVRCHDTAHRFVRRTNDREMLIYVDGSCLDQNDADVVENRRAGCAWVFKPAPYSSKQRGKDIRLENEGPDGQEYPQTSNRAELRAALGALQYRSWQGEGWHTIVVASDSEYLVLGITERIEKWASSGWRTGAGKAVKNKDLWKALLDRINELAKAGTEVMFWRIPREQNAEADEAARNAARIEAAVKKYTIHHGTLV